MSFKDFLIVALGLFCLYEIIPDTWDVVVDNTPVYRVGSEKLNDIYHVQEVPYDGGHIVNCSIVKELLGVKQVNGKTALHNFNKATHMNGYGLIRAACNYNKVKFDVTNTSISVSVDNNSIVSQVSINGRLPSVKIIIEDMFIHSGWWTVRSINGEIKDYAEAARLNNSLTEEFIHYNNLSEYLYGTHYTSFGESILMPSANRLAEYHIETTTEPTSDFMSSTKKYKHFMKITGLL